MKIGGFFCFYVNRNQPKPTESNRNQPNPTEKRNHYFLKLKYLSYRIKTVKLERT